MSSRTGVAFFWDTLYIRLFMYAMQTFFKEFFFEKSKGFPLPQCKENLSTVHVCKIIILTSHRLSSHTYSRFLVSQSATAHCCPSLDTNIHMSGGTINTEFVKYLCSLQLLLSRQDVLNIWCGRLHNSVISMSGLNFSSAVWHSAQYWQIYSIPVSW